MNGPKLLLIDKYKKKIEPYNSEGSLNKKYEWYHIFLTSGWQIQGLLGSINPNGWIKKYGSLVIDLMSLPPAPDGIMELVHCSCKSTGCAKGKCSCLSNHFLCTDLRFVKIVVIAKFLNLQDYI